MRAIPFLLLAITMPACEDRPDGLSMQRLPSILDAASDAVEALGPVANDAVACKTLIAGAGALSSAASVSRGALAAAQGGDATLPAISVDVSACGSLPAPVDVSAEVEKGLAMVNAVRPMLVIALDNAIPEEKCKLQAWVEAITPYAFAVGDAVLAEIAEPDGRVDISSTNVALSSCK